MRNEEFKKRYLKKIEEESEGTETQKQRLQYVQRIFKDIEEDEELYRKDCAEFTVSEITNFYTGLCSSSIARLNITNSYLLNYTKYVVSNGLIDIKDGQNHYSEISVQLLHSCINAELAVRRIISRDDLMATITDWQCDSDKWLVLALFEGINGIGHSELARALPSDFADGTFQKDNGLKISVSKELVDFASKADREDELPPTLGGGSSRKNLQGDNRIIRASWNVHGEENDNQRRRRIIARLDRIKNAVGEELAIQFSSNALTMSGMIHSIKQMIESGRISTLKEFFENKESLKEVEDRYGRIHQPKQFMITYQNLFY